MRTKGMMIVKSLKKKNKYGIMDHSVAELFICE